MQFLRALYLTRRFYAALLVVAALFAAAYALPALAVAAQIALAVVAVLAVLDAVALFRLAGGVEARRVMPERLSNGDENAIRIHLASRFPFAVRCAVIDEWPAPFQKRDAERHLTLPSGGQETLGYRVRPVRRGEYAFGALNVFAASPLGLVRRRFRFEEGRTVPVYPSYQQMRRYALLAASNRLTEAGVKQQRRLGHTMEFDHIRPYVTGDDVRAVNWKATARRGQLMTNQYRETRGQPVYCLLDAGRVMKMPFEQMTLLDWSINAALALSSVAVQKQDRAGLMLFSNEMRRVVPAARRGGQVGRIQEALYNAETNFLETDYERLVAHVRRTVRQRSLLLLFTNFETRASLRRQLPSLRLLAQRHAVVALFFENTTLRAVRESRPETTEGIYVKTMAEQFAYEKREVVRVLRQHGIYAVLTPPEALTVRTLNAYLALKARGVV